MFRNFKKFAQYVLHFMLGYFYFFLSIFFILAFLCRCLVLLAILSFLSSSFLHYSFVSCLSFLLPNYFFVLLPRTTFCLISFLWLRFRKKSSENILTGLYSQCLSACYRSNTAGEYHYNKLLRFVVTFRFYLKSDNGDGHHTGKPMLVYACISTANRTHLAKYLFIRKMFGTRCREL